MWCFCPNILYSFDCKVIYKNIVLKILFEKQKKCKNLEYVVKNSTKKLRPISIKYTVCSDLKLLEKVCERCLYLYVFFILRCLAAFIISNLYKKNRASGHLSK